MFTCRSIFYIHTHTHTHTHIFRSRGARAGSWERAWVLLGGMERDGIEPDMRACNAVLGACGGCRQWALALHVEDPPGFGFSFWLLGAWLDRA